MGFLFVNNKPKRVWMGREAHQAGEDHHKVADLHVSRVGQIDLLRIRNQIIGVPLHISLCKCLMWPMMPSFGQHPRSTCVFGGGGGGSSP